MLQTSIAEDKTNLTRVAFHGSSCPSRPGLGTALSQSYFCFCFVSDVVGVDGVGFQVIKHKDIIGAEGGVGKEVES